MAAVGSRARVYVDGGVRDGLDVLGAHALGADMTFLGRPFLYALSTGESAVKRLHEVLRDQLVEALRLSGCTNPREAARLLG